MEFFLEIYLHQMINYPSKNFLLDMEPQLVHRAYVSRSPNSKKVLLETLGLLLVQLNKPPIPRQSSPRLHNYNQTDSSHYYHNNHHQKYHNNYRNNFGLGLSLYRTVLRMGLHTAVASVVLVVQSHDELVVWLVRRCFVRLIRLGLA